MARRNRIKVALPLYGVVSATFLQQWLSFQSQIAQYDKYSGLITTQRAYVDLAMNEIVGGALQDKAWDYLFIIEQDMKMPPGLLERIGVLDPETHPIVGCLYFGRVQDDQRPVCGHMREGVFHRLTYEQVCEMLPERGGVAGFHPVDVIGMGATAIHRSVFENWPFSQPHPFFRTDYDSLGFMGHDIWFGTECAKLGLPIYVDSSMVAEHLGEWRSNSVTYLATMEHQRAQAPWTPPPTMMTDDELTYLAQLAAGKRVLEVGSQYGNSTVAMARKAAEVVAIDWFMGDAHAGSTEAGSTRTTYFRHLDHMAVTHKVITVAARWEDALPRLTGKFDLIFLDAMHGEEATADLLAASLPFLAEGGLIAAHDYGRFGVKPAVDAIQDAEQCDLAVVDTLAVLGNDIPPFVKQVNLYLPHVFGRLRPETATALAQTPTTLVPMEADDSYYQMIQRLWEKGDAFITIEQDIVPTPEQIAELRDCGEPWCAFAYEYPPFGKYAGMGFAKFSAALMRAEPDAMKITGLWSDAKHPPKHWCRVDGWLKKFLIIRGHTQHIHGEVKHLHSGKPAHDCTTPEEAAAIIAAQAR